MRVAVAAYVMCVLAGLAVTLNTIGVSWGPAVASGITAALSAWSGVNGIAIHVTARNEARKARNGDM